MDGLQRWCRVTILGADGAVLAACVLEGPGDPDLGAVDDVARLALQVARLGGGVALAEVSPAMRELLELAGLGVEVEGQTEFGEEPLRVQEVQEEAHPGDLSP
jgi:hypothetical protein